MLKKLKEILNTYTDEELEELYLYVNSNIEIDQIIIDEFSIDLITRDKKVDVKDEWGKFIN